MQGAFDSHLAFEIVAAGATVATTIVGLMIRNSIITSKMELLEKQTELKDELNAKHAENREQFVAHVAEDTEKFVGIGRTLDRMDRKLDTLAGRH